MGPARESCLRNASADTSRPLDCDAIRARTSESLWDVSRPAEARCNRGFPASGFRGSRPRQTLSRRHWRQWGSHGSLAAGSFSAVSALRISLVSFAPRAASPKMRDGGIPGRDLDIVSKASAVGAGIPEAVGKHVHREVLCDFVGFVGIFEEHQQIAANGRHVADDDLNRIVSPSTSVVIRLRGRFWPLEIGGESVLSIGATTPFNTPSRPLR